MPVEVFGGNTSVESTGVPRFDGCFFTNVVVSAGRLVFKKRT